MDKGHGVNLVAEAQSKAWRYQIGVTQVLANSTGLGLFRGSHASNACKSTLYNLKSQLEV